CAGVTSVPSLLDHLREALCEQVDVSIFELKKRMPQYLTSTLVKVLDLPTRWLNRFPPVMQVPQLANLLHPDFVRRTSTRIVRQPPSVRRPNEVEARDHGFSPCKGGCERETMNQDSGLIYRFALGKSSANR